jgi:hypothetical protein
MVNKGFLATKSAAMLAKVAVNILPENFYVRRHSLDVPNSCF